MAAGMASFIQFSQHEDPWIYYLGATLLFFGFSVYNTAFRTVYSQFIGNSPYISFMFALMFIAGAGSQFLGPLLSGVFLSVGVRVRMAR